MKQARNMRRNENRSLTASPAYNWGGDEFRISNHSPRLILCLPGKGSFDRSQAIAPQWELLYNAASNLVAALKDAGHEGLPDIHTRHIVEIGCEQPGEETWWLCCQLPEGPARSDWESAMLRDEVSLNLKAIAGLCVRETVEGLIAETRCDAPHPFHAPDIERLREFCTLNIFSVAGPYSWITDLDANTGSLGLSILRVPVRNNGIKLDGKR